LSKTPTDEIHFIQRAFLEGRAVNCGYCTPGMIMSTKAFLDCNLDPSVDDIKTTIEGNLCRCGGYLQIIKAIKTAAERGSLPGQ